MYALCHAPDLANMLVADPARMRYAAPAGTPNPIAGRQRNAAYLLLNPNGVVPTLAERLTAWA
jgi:hypothetical protein